MVSVDLSQDVQSFAPPNSDEPGSRPPDAQRVSQPATARAGWLVGPWFDLLLVANLAWPLVLLWQFDESFAGRDGLRFWQVYYVTTPHRWITLVLVFLDKQRFEQRPRAFVGLALFFTALCGGVYWGTGGLTCLLTIDYLWNAWHFAAQHHGVYRIYRRQMPASPWALQGERWGLRIFLLYVILRVALSTGGAAAWEPWLQRLDIAFLLLPLALIVRELTSSRFRNWGSTAYLASVLGLYIALLASVRLNAPGLILALTTASALFHATEYLAVVGWTMQKRHAQHGERLGLMAYLVPRWGITLGIFVLVLGIGGWLMDRHYLQLWLAVNVVVAFLHYSYDGLIWRRGKSTAANSPSTTARTAAGAPGL